MSLNEMIRGDALVRAYGLWGDSSNPSQPRWYELSIDQTKEDLFEAEEQIDRQFDFILEVTINHYVYFHERNEYLDTLNRRSGSDREDNPRLYRAVTDSELQP